jgi:hypothetical protein
MLPDPVSGSRPTPEVFPLSNGSAFLLRIGEVVRASARPRWSSRCSKC